MSDEELSQSKATPEEMMSDEQRATLQKESAEGRLAPETLAMIMDKVRDIDQPGIAFTAIGSTHGEAKGQELDFMRSILENGLIGTNDDPHTAIERTLIRQDYYKKLKDRDADNAKIWFNITGRMNDIKEMKEKYPDQKEVALTSWSIFGAPLITFDISHFREKEYSQGYVKEEGTNRPVWKGDYFNNSKHNTLGEDAYSALGFTTFYRIPPSFLTGIILDQQDTIDQNTLIQTMVDLNSATPGKILPIYNKDGNLLWPQQMSYEEVKQFVAERDAKKQEQEENA